MAVRQQDAGVNQSLSSSNTPSSQASTATNNTGSNPATWNPVTDNTYADNKGQAIQVLVHEYLQPQNRQSSNTRFPHQDRVAQRERERERNAPGFGSSYENDFHNSCDDENESVLESVRSRKTRRYCTGGIATYSNRTGIIAFIRETNVDHVAIKLTDTTRGCLAEKLTVYQTDCDMVE